MRQRARDRKRMLGTQKGRKNGRGTRARPLNQGPRAEITRTTDSAASSQATLEVVLSYLLDEDRDYKTHGANRMPSFEKVFALTSTILLVAAFSATPAAPIVPHALPASSVATYLDPEEPPKRRVC